MMHTFWFVFGIIFVGAGGLEIPNLTLLLQREINSRFNLGQGIGCQLSLLPKPFCLALPSYELRYREVEDMSTISLARKTEGFSSCARAFWSYNVVPCLSARWLCILCWRYLGTICSVMLFLLNGTDLIRERANNLWRVGTNNIPLQEKASFTA